MKQTFAVQNVKCGGCASSLKKALADDFADIEVNLDTTPKEISLDIEESQIELLKQKLESAGYPLV